MAPRKLNKLVGRVREELTEQVKKNQLKEQIHLMAWLLVQVLSNRQSVPESVKEKP